MPLGTVEEVLGWARGNLEGEERDNVEIPAILAV